MKLQLNLKNQNAYTVEDIQASMLVLAGELGKLGYCLDGMSYNSETPITGFPLKNARTDKHLRIESNLDQGFVYSDSKEIELITIDAVAAGVTTKLAMLYYVRYNHMFTTSYEYAVAMVDKIIKRRRNARYRYGNRYYIPVTRNNAKLIHSIKGFKTAKLENVKLLVLDLWDLERKQYVLLNTKTGTEKTFTLNH